MQTEDAVLIMNQDQGIEAILPIGIIADHPHHDIEIDVVHLTPGADGPRLPGTDTNCIREVRLQQDPGAAQNLLQDQRQEEVLKLLLIHTHPTKPHTNQQNRGMNHLLRHQEHRHQRGRPALLQEKETRLLLKKMAL